MQPRQTSFLNFTGRSDFGSQKKKKRAGYTQTEHQVDELLL